MQKVIFVKIILVKEVVWCLVPIFTTFTTVTTVATFTTFTTVTTVTTVTIVNTFTTVTTVATFTTFTTVTTLVTFSQSPNEPMDRQSIRHLELLKAAKKNKVLFIKKIANTFSLVVKELFLCQGGEGLVHYGSTY